MNDINGQEIKKGMEVSMPEPNDTDTYNHAFIGTVVGFRFEYVLVVDQEESYHCIEPERIEVVEE